MIHIEKSPKQWTEQNLCQAEKEWEALLNQKVHRCFRVGVLGYRINSESVRTNSIG